MKRFFGIMLSMPIVAATGAVMALDSYLRMLNGVPVAPPPCECEVPYAPPETRPSCAPGRWN